MPISNADAIINICEAINSADEAYKEITDPDDADWKDVYMVLIRDTILPKLRDADSGDPETADIPDPPSFAI